MKAPSCSSEANNAESAVMAERKDRFMDDHNATHHRMQPCPYCGFKIDAAGTIDNAPVMPTPGDLTVCIQCAGVLMYDGPRLTIRQVPAQELMAIFAANPGYEAEFSRTLAAVKAFQRSRPMKPARGSVPRVKSETE
jgi:hypothetical protein